MPERTAGRRPLVLDTHVWVRYALGVRDLVPAAVKAIDSAVARGALLIPAIAVWEIALLVQRNRILLEQPIRQWIETALLQPGVALAPLTPDIAIDSCSLPGDFHKDPADRMIVATARVHNAVVLTQDRAILAYAKAGHVAAMAA